MSQVKTIKIDNKEKEMSFAEVLSQFTPAIYKEINRQKSKFDRKEEEYDDLFQNASIWLWKAYNVYDINLGNHFSTIAFPYIKKGVQEITDLNNAQKRGVIDYSTSLDAQLTSDDGGFSLSNILPASINIEDEVELQEMLSSFINTLTEKEKTAFQFILEGRHSTELAKAEGVTRQCSAARYRQVKDKFLQDFYNDIEGVLV